ncbi:MAG: ribosome maturation factor RimP [Syntrophobacteraceae bacterium]
MAQQLTKEEDLLVGEIWSLLEPVVAAQGMEILEIEYRRESIGWVLRIFIDSERGIAVDDCAAISRLASDLLDVSDLIHTHYNLEVSSPGIDRPLRKLEQFQKYIGDIIEVRTISPIQERRNFKGILQDAEAAGISIECDGKNYSIPLAFIERARLLYFESIERKSR